MSCILYIDVSFRVDKTRNGEVECPRRTQGNVRLLPRIKKKEKFGAEVINCPPTKRSNRFHWIQDSFSIVVEKGGDQCDLRWVGGGRLDSHLLPVHLNAKVAHNKGTEVGPL
jgi:hypothetical protein